MNDTAEDERNRMRGELEIMAKQVARLSRETTAMREYLRNVARPHLLECAEDSPRTRKALLELEDLLDRKFKP